MVQRGAEATVSWTERFAALCAGVITPGGVGEFETRVGRRNAVRTRLLQRAGRRKSQDAAGDPWKFVCWKQAIGERPCCCERQRRAACYSGSAAVSAAAVNVSCMPLSLGPSQDHWAGFSTGRMAMERLSVGRRRLRSGSPELILFCRREGAWWRVPSGTAQIHGTGSARVVEFRQSSLADFHRQILPELEKLWRPCGVAAGLAEWVSFASDPSVSIRNRNSALHHSKLPSPTWKSHPIHFGYRDSTTISNQHEQADDAQKPLPADGIPPMRFGGVSSSSSFFFFFFASLSI